MAPHLFNILQKLKQIREFLLQEGPLYLNKVSDLLSFLASLGSQIATYVGQYGGQQFTLGSGVHHAGGVDSDDAQNSLKEIQTMYQEFQALGKKADEEQKQYAQQTKEGAQKGLIGDLLNRISPDMKKFILGIVTELINKLLLKSGISIPLGDAVPEQQTGRGIPFKEQVERKSPKSE